MSTQLSHSTVRRIKALISSTSISLTRSEGIAFFNELRRINGVVVQGSDVVGVTHVFRFVASADKALVRITAMTVGKWAAETAPSDVLVPAVMASEREEQMIAEAEADGSLAPSFEMPRTRNKRLKALRA